jgi:hypothetical protein
MAAMAAQGGDQAPRLPMPSRNPLPLSASQEAQVRDIFYDRVRKMCAPEIKGMPFPCLPSHNTPHPSPSVSNPLHAAHTTHIPPKRNPR